MFSFSVGERTVDVVLILLVVSVWSLRDDRIVSLGDHLGGIVVRDSLLPGVPSQFRITLDQIIQDFVGLGALLNFILKEEVASVEPHD